MFALMRLELRLFSRRLPEADVHCELYTSTRFEEESVEGHACRSCNNRKSDAHSRGRTSVEDRNSGGTVHAKKSGVHYIYIIF